MFVSAKNSNFRRKKLTMGVDVWGLVAGCGAERFKGKLGKNKDDGNWGDVGDVVGVGVSVWGVWPWCWG